jgi:branched-chain amino acid transport system ATP-binding protein
LPVDALRFSGVDVFYGESHALHGVSFSVGEGRVLGLLGRNGAGKTTCMNTTVGLLRPRSGDIALFGEKISAAGPESISRKGIALVPQGRRVFKRLTVRENLVVASRRSSAQQSFEWTLDTVFDEFPRLRERSSSFAGTLSGGEQQMLAIGRALMSNPRVLLMDEPSEGLAPQIVAGVFTTITKLKSQGLSIVLVEQNPKLAIDIADDIVVLNSGTVVVAETTDSIRRGNIDLSRHLGVMTADDAVP